MISIGIKKSEPIEADGVIYGIIPHSEEAIEQTKKVVLNTSKECRQQIFVIPKHYKEIEVLLGNLTLFLN